MFYKKDIYISVIMPTFNHCAFIRRAVLSLIAQTYDKWELIIIDDGSTDDTYEQISDLLINDDRIIYIFQNENRGLGYSLNVGLSLAKYDYIAYLPSDDYYFNNHIENIVRNFFIYNDVVLVCSGVRFDDCDSLHGSYELESKIVKKDFTMQLVQVAHKKVSEKWVEREEWISDDLFSMYWCKLLPYGRFINIGIVTAYWTQHPKQRFRIINEKYGGGINKIRSFYKIKKTIKIKVSKEKFIDEDRQYRHFRDVCQLSKNKLKILIVGELAYNPERIYALEEAGNELYGLWVPEPSLSFSTVGPLPFGHVEDIPHSNWRQRIREIKPDIIYGMLNCGAIQWVYDVVREFPEIPFAWHYKEGPQLAMRCGLWSQLVWLYSHADVKIYLNSVVKNWFGLFIKNDGLSIIMDGDLPKRDYFKLNFSPKLSKEDGEIHTVCAGRPIGLGEKAIGTLVKNRIHVHLYLENFHASREKLFNYYKNKYKGYFHTHTHCSAENWTKEFSKYDAAWLHCIKSHNEGNLMKATWDDLNIPARLNTYMAAGIPVILPKNTGNVVAVENIVKEYNIGYFFSDIIDLVSSLKDDKKKNQIIENVMNNRDLFCFDHYVPELIAIFKIAIAKKNG
ncbi:glycosyltransferase family 2 protein [Prevotella sp. HCN-7019]|uniref:glycosyltransferase family 2 protein n=1 Tax=Prevotella sp. HCN-7019 TaxID=3134668 RepID=UPI0030BB160E